MRGFEMESFDGKHTKSGIISSSLKTNLFELQGKSWFVTAEAPCDLLVQVQDFTFHLHKFPLHSRSGRISRTIYESRTRDLRILVLDDLPGGSEAFGLVAKFCYGVPIDLTPANVSELRCAAEYLEMTEDIEEGNLISKTESYLSYDVLSSWKDSILVLKSCEKLSPWAENLQIVRRCSKAIAWKACTNSEGVCWAHSRKSSSVSSPRRSNLRDPGLSRPQPLPAPSEWWFEDISVLRIDHFVRVINAIKVKGMGSEQVGAAIMNYASKWLPGLLKEKMSDENNPNSPSTDDPFKDSRMIIESLISIIPQQKDCVSCNFLLRLLRMSNMYNVSPALVTDLEKRIGMQFDQATLEDLLIPCHNKCEILTNVDLVQRLLEHFLVQDHMESSRSHPYENEAGGENQRSSNGFSSKMKVARLVDSYLTKASRDGNLTLTKFQVLAETLPENARSCHDGLYRAIDSYLMAHPMLTEHERRKICRVMDCEKLSIEACLHAAQNEQLPLRVVVQILFHGQQRISQAMANKSLMEASKSQCEAAGATREGLMERPAATHPKWFHEGWERANRDIKALKFELESLKVKYLELQHEMDTFQSQLDSKSKPSKPLSAWCAGWKKLAKLTKADHLQTFDAGHPTATPAADQVKKISRRWRNSIS
uniref:Root phototropism protein 3 n=1 Tax=Kalanchoe fedtschenkoi TaxID=63787 RepID=A0A7N0T4H8_KALFE